MLSNRLGLQSLQWHTWVFIPVKMDQASISHKALQKSEYHPSASELRCDYRGRDPPGEGCTHCTRWNDWKKPTSRAETKQILSLQKWLVQRAQRVQPGILPHSSRGKQKNTEASPQTPHIFSIYLLPWDPSCPPATIPAFSLCLAQMSPFPLLNSSGKHPPVRNHSMVSVPLRRGCAIIESAWLTSSTCHTVPYTAQNSSGAFQLTILPKSSLLSSTSFPLIAPLNLL